MNWAEIKEKYTNAYMKLLDAEGLTDNMATFNLYDPENDAEFNIRKLYDFFDECGIDCFIVPGLSGTEKTPMICNMYRGNEYSIRIEAEVDLFTKAFEILNEKIKYKEIFTIKNCE